MNTKKILLFLLIIVALCIWGRDALLIVKGVSDDKKATIENQTEEDPFAVAPYVYKSDFRDPFFCKYFMTESTMQGGQKAKGASSAKISLPQCSIGGIVYNENNPMVLFHIGGKSLYAKQGDVIDSIKIKKIGRDSVVLSYKNKKFVIGK